MATTLSRRIRRIGLLPSTKDEQGKTIHVHNPELTSDARTRIAQGLIADAKARRVAAKK